MSKVSLARQVTAVELMVANTRGNMDIQRDLIRQKKRDDSVLQIIQGYYPDLCAAAQTMRWLLKNEDKIKKFMMQDLQGD